jgi:serine phosphatase RsbU (regulator of sigma subunit)
MKKAVILCVDDEKMVLSSLKSELKESLDNEYIIEVCEDPTESIEIFKELIENGYDIPLIISDYVMPVMKGDELLKNFHLISPETNKIMLTGQATTEGVTNAVNWARLYRYIGKPWESNDLCLTVKQAIKSYYQAKQLNEQNVQLRELNNVLEAKVEERTAEILNKNHILEQQKNKLFQVNVDITASINYARKIQQALLPSKNIFCEIFPQSFVFYRPKDIVSGDFYWVNSLQYYVKELDETITESIAVVADCTGHGVPGAFMSMLGLSFLSEIVKTDITSGELLQPAIVLDHLKEKVKTSLRQTGKDNDNKDGMDISLCIINSDRTKLRYAGAFNPLFVFRENENPDELKLIELKADRMPIGIYYNEKGNFTNHEIDIIKGDKIYLFSDGYIDQFGGDNCDKYKIRQFRSFLKSICHFAFPKQRELLKENFNNWKNDFEQIDDVTVLGFEI